MLRIASFLLFVALFSYFCEIWDSILRWKMKMCYFCLSLLSDLVFALWIGNVWITTIHTAFASGWLFRSSICIGQCGSISVVEDVQGIHSGKDGWRECFLLIYKTSILIFFLSGKNEKNRNAIMDHTFGGIEDIGAFNHILFICLFCVLILACMWVLVTLSGSFSVLSPCSFFRNT